MPSISMKRRTSRGATIWEFFCNLCAGLGRFRLHSRVRFDVDRAGAAPKRTSGAPAGSRLPTALGSQIGLLRQKKFDLAAQEYERILKAGATGTGAGRRAIWARRVHGCRWAGIERPEEHSTIS